MLVLLAVPAIGGEGVCANCHPKEVRGYQQSAMAHSLSRAASQPDGSFEHAASHTHFVIRTGAAGMLQELERDGEAEQQQVAYVIGSGTHAFGYLVRIGDHLFQSPLSYYTGRRLWDVAPGYEESRHPDFSRPVTIECLLCHSGKPQPIRDSLNRYQSPAFLAEGISCDRCHGPGEAHAKNPMPGSIVNPAKLTGAARDSICEQCHLTGEVRIPNPGKSIADFRPGETLEESFTVYVAARQDGKTLKVVSHAEQLALSMCARASGGKLWCGTCHNPHETPADPAAYFRARCLGCHGATLEKAHAAGGRDCIACHMPRLPARDGGHTAFTDHRIRRRPDAVGESSDANDLRAWREPDAKFRQRNLALALVTVGLEDKSAEQAVRGFRTLYRIEKEYPNDPDVLTTLGSVLLRGKQPEEALRRFEKVLALRPAYAPYEVNAAAALLAMGKKSEAQLHLESALRLDPLLEQAIAMLGKVYADEGNDSRAHALITQYRVAMGFTSTH